MSTADFTSPGLIVSQLRGRDAASVVLELSEALHSEGRVQELVTFYRAVMDRESLASTEMETSTAFPHARLPGLKELSFAFGQNADGIAWGVRGRVRFIFLIAVPESESEQYLLLISGLACLVSNGRYLEQLRGTQNARQILGTFQQVKLKTNSQPDSPKTFPTPI